VTSANSLTDGRSRPGAWRSVSRPGIGVDSDGGPTIALVRWPQDEEMLERLGPFGHPRLLLVDPDADPPVVTDPLEDWIRLPADDRDIQTRVASLRRRVGHHRIPVFDGACRVGFRDGWAPLSPIEYCLASALVEQFGYLVADEDLSARAWGDTTPRSGALRVHLTRLRRRVEPIGLEILTVRSHGHVMQEAGATRPPNGSSPAPVC
jgi:Transcriptional regulatory protein, C terminal